MTVRFSTTNMGFALDIVSVHAAVLVMRAEEWRDPAAADAWRLVEEAIDEVRVRMRRARLATTSNVLEADKDADEVQPLHHVVSPTLELERNARGNVGICAPRSRAENMRHHSLATIVIERADVGDVVKFLTSYGGPKR